MAYNNRSIRSQITQIGTKRPVPATIIDVLGQACSVRLSTRGAVLRNLQYTGPKPKKGDSVFVDYSGGTPTVIASYAEDIVAASTATQRPIITAIQSISSAALEPTSPTGVVFDEILALPVYVSEDLTAQITGSNTHFTLTDVALETPVVSCNLEQNSNCVLMDTGMNGFVLTFTPTTRDVLMARYRKAGVV